MNEVLSLLNDILTNKAIMGFVLVMSFIGIGVCCCLCAISVRALIKHLKVDWREEEKVPLKKVV